MDIGEGVLPNASQLYGSDSPYDAGEDRVRVLFDPHGQLADLDGFESLAGMDDKRVAYEVSDSCEHSGYHFRFRPLRRLACHMLEHETRLPVNEKDLINA